VACAGRLLLEKKKANAASASKKIRKVSNHPFVMPDIRGLVAVVPPRTQERATERLALTCRPPRTSPCAT